MTLCEGGLDEQSPHSLPAHYGDAMVSQTSGYNGMPYEAADPQVSNGNRVHLCRYEHAVGWSDIELPEASRLTHYTHTQASCVTSALTRCKITSGEFWIDHMCFNIQKWQLNHY